MTHNATAPIAQPIATTRHALTFFDDKFASKKYDDALTLPELADEIAQMHDSSKKKLPWLKMAIFGDTPSAKRSYRTNANLQEITGGEVDYDGGVMSFDEAVARLRKANLRCIVYTSASHTPDKPRWRVLAPTSKALAPSCRAGLVAILNGVLGGVVASESFALSTAYYYGYVDPAHHRVEVLDGDFVCQRDDLWETRQYKEKKGAQKQADFAPPAPGAAQGYDDADITEMLKRCRDRSPDGGGQWHSTMLSVTASLVNKGWSDERIYEITAPYCDDGWGDGDVEALIKGARAKYGLPDPDRLPDLSEAIGPIVAQAIRERGGVQPEAVSWRADRPEEGPPPDSKRDDYYAYLPTHQYIYRYTGRLYPLASINATLDKVTIGTKPKKQTKKQAEAGEEPEVVAKQIPASLWLDRNRAVMEMSWLPGEGELIADQLPDEGGWVHKAGVKTFNQYRPPAAVAGDPAKAGRWLELVRQIYPDHADHLVRFFAHCVQRPGEKINHALVLTGSPGVGKDTMLEPLKRGVGDWNFKEISPHDISSNNNDFMKSVVLRVSETRDLGETNRYSFYESTKTMIAAPPNMTRINVKHVPQYYVPNVTSVIFTTNYPDDGLYLPPDDRRHYVCGTELSRSEAWDAHCVATWGWYQAGGLDDVVAYLRAYDLSGFDAKLPPEKTTAFWRMVDAGRPAEENEFRDAITKMGDPTVLTVDALAVHASHDLAIWIRDRSNNRNVSRRLADCGYITVRNHDEQSGRWKMGGDKKMIHGRKDIPIADRYAAAVELKRRADAAAKRIKDEIGKMVPRKGG